MQKEWGEWSSVSGASRDYPASGPGLNERQLDADPTYDDRLKVSQAEKKTREEI